MNQPKEDWVFIFELASGEQHTFVKTMTLDETEEVLAHVVDRLTVQKLPIRVGTEDTAGALVIYPELKGR